ncbi:DUF2236 domain-containing protein [Rathayibacter rathayi]|uniref:DUF2236 domain-containing protein n=1 Tax=Rathayibacter rathayi TaxID=33887 RepID=A0ABD6W5P3_RATRA|nr:oxygenase MpaB family protein [Rathayibacter rathayi]AZZ48134.1 DUF2236 domain-containing protein [Rathayibacter rathayi]MWV75549.1 DUF2236 domain-containing protein [Rathayibacter rathayi NCPPB 2980 = VKM Ac-1601]PPF10266.1 DUF2236 domain-containing protein [Rathayibacter rathayi]PPF43029.1 DUF2236 domain-containing protein [Rathayibacter rathayi]PPF75385.1 DUF2236 domain-containing protein [Rathayibacter rathayi]
MSSASPTPDVFREGVFLVAGARAILLQIAYPAVGQGVAEHSDFVRRAANRLHGTLSYLYVLHYGTAEDVRAVRRRVNRAHLPVRGPGYTAFDPELQRWVAATLTQSMLQLYEGAFGALTEEEADDIVRRSVVVGAALQMPEELWPDSRAAFDAYWQRELGRLEVTPAARRVAQDLLGPSIAAWYLRPLGPYLRLMTAGLLPAELREPFGFRWSARQEARFERALGCTFAIYRRLPAAFRTAPSRYYLARVRRDAQKAATTSQPA